MLKWELSGTFQSLETLNAGDSVDFLAGPIVNFIVFADTINSK
jgi:hypothetical protein